MQSLQQELATTNRTLASTKEAEAKLRAELVDLYAKCAELESAVLQVEREKEKATALEVGFLSPFFYYVFKFFFRLKWLG